MTGGCFIQVGAGEWRAQIPRFLWFFYFISLAPRSIIFGYFYLQEQEDISCRFDFYRSWGRGGGADVDRLDWIELKAGNNFFFTRVGVGG
jgi:hypothetical protein